ncbi:hypothetical protein K7G98_36300, partial [Saccharothrix sp. MB29]|nr:hypothetical protein [Saccharothrix sp. MB29]
TVVEVALTAAALVAAAVCTLLGLPTTVAPWLVWVGKNAGLTAELISLRLDHRQELRDDILISELRNWLGKQATPSFDLELHLRDARDLTTPAGKGPLVTTPAVKACQREVNRATPGAVGLAGPRGVGKTTIA